MEALAWWYAAAMGNELKRAMAWCAAMVVWMGVAREAGAQATTNPASGGGGMGGAGKSGSGVVAPARERDGAGRVVGPGRAGWWNDAVFYQVFVRSFADSREGPLAGDGIGDFQGLIERLDSLNDGDGQTTSDLGVTALWLMPVNASPSYHGYDVTDYRDTQREYGTPEDFQRLMRECHRRGIRVIVDLVMNHSSDEHAWFVEAKDPASARHDWYIWSATDKGSGKDGYRGPWNQRVWHKLRKGDGKDGKGKSGEDGKGDRAAGRRDGAGGEAWYYGIFSGKMPDLDYRNEDVSREMMDVAGYWLKPEAEGGMGADGLRLDAIRHLIEDGAQQDNTPETHAWLRAFRESYKEAGGAASGGAGTKSAEKAEATSRASVVANDGGPFAIGEVWASSAIASSYVGDGELDAAFEFDLAGAMVESARSGDAGPVKWAQEEVLRLYPPNQYGRFLTNHDQTRVMSELKGDEGAMRMAAAMLLLGPGVPFIYYGEELGMPGEKPDPDLRTPMPWTAEEGNAGFAKAGVTPWRAVTKEAARINVERQRGEAGSLWNLYRKLIKLRAEHEALRSGTYEEVDVEALAKPEGGGFVKGEPGIWSVQGKDGLTTTLPGVYAFVRTSEDKKDSLLMVMNLGKEPVYEVKVSRPRVKGKGVNAKVYLSDGMGDMVGVGVDVSEERVMYRPVGTKGSFPGRSFVVVRLE